jgi:hypothetical protein
MSIAQSDDMIIEQIESVKKVEQKEFVFQTIKKIVLEEGPLPEGKTYFDVLNTKAALTTKPKILRKRVRLELLIAIQTGIVSCKKDISDEKVLKHYCSLCVSNWIKKDTRLR